MSFIERGRSNDDLPEKGSDAAVGEEGCTFGVELETTGGDGKKVYFVHYYGNTVAFPADACEEVFMKGEQT